jgi:hypothetical protein
MKVTGACLAAVMGSLDWVLAMRRSNDGRPVAGRAKVVLDGELVCLDPARDPRTASSGNAAV